MSEPAATAPFADCVTFLPSADLEATSAFYETALGLPLALDQGGCRIYRTSPNGAGRRSKMSICASVTSPCTSSGMPVRCMAS